MNEILTVALGRNALNYMVDGLATGRTLSHLLLERTDLDRGRMFTAVPPEAREQADDLTSTLIPPILPPEDAEHSESLEHSDSMMIEKPTLVWDLAQRIARFLSVGGQRLCLLQNPIADATDPWLEGVDHRLLTLGPEVYHVVDPAVPAGDVEQVVRDAFSTYEPPLVGILTTGDIGSSARRTIRTSELRRLANDATTFFVTAYRGQGFLYWCIDDVTTDPSG